MIRYRSNFTFIALAVVLLLASTSALVLVVAPMSGLATAKSSDRLRAARSSMPVTSIVGLGLPAAYAALHQAGLKVGFRRSFSIDWSGECIPLVTGSTPQPWIIAAPGSTVRLTTAKPACGAASPGVPVLLPRPARVRSFAGRSLAVAIRWVARHHLTWAATIPALRDGDARTLYSNYTITGQRPRPGAMLALGIAVGDGWQPTPLQLTVRSRRAR